MCVCDSSITVPEFSLSVFVSLWGQKSGFGIGFGYHNSITVGDRDTYVNNLPKVNSRRYSEDRGKGMPYVEQV